jgi:hypothetical protein
MNLFNQKIKSVLFVLLLVFSFLNQQAQVTINGAAVININGGISGMPAYLVLNTPPASGITVIGTTGGIIMESEYNITKYNLGLSTTSFTVPYYSMNATGAFPGNQFPLTVTGISGAGGTAANCFLQFSSKHAPAFASGWDNATYVPSDVIANPTTMQVSTGGGDNSSEVIDRFWVIDEIGYTTSPAVTLAFGFINNEAAANGGNTIPTVNDLQVMAYDKGAFTWSNYGPTGVNTSGTPTGTVSAAGVSSGLIGNVFRTWTLVNHLTPLPVDLLGFSGICYGNINANLTWSTAIETNSSYFTIEKSTDGQNFTWLTNVNAVGNSTHKQNYSYVDITDISAVTYYRLSETDVNGNKKTFNTIVVNGCDENLKENITTFSANGNISLNVYSLSNQPMRVVVYDVTGRLIYKEDLAVVQGNNTFTVNPIVANGIYVVQAETNLASIVERVPVIK